MSKHRAKATHLLLMVIAASISGLSPLVCSLVSSGHVPEMMPDHKWHNFNLRFPNLKGVIFYQNMVRDQTNYLTPYPRIPVQEPLGLWLQL